VKVLVRQGKAAGTFASIERAGFAPLRLARLRELLEVQDLPTA